MDYYKITIEEKCMKQGKDGGLIGGASLKAENFIHIINGF